MDGDGDGMDGGMDGGIGGMSGAGMGGVDGNRSVSMEDSDGDSATSSLQSMGYIDSGAEVGTHRNPTGSGSSVVQAVVIVAVVAFFVLSLAFYLLQAILEMLGVTL